jgi:K+-transporting ATPase ATPase A chain
MRKMPRNIIGPSVLATLVLALITGLLYTAVVTGIAQVAFPHQSNGSPVEHNGTTVGSGLIGQNFTSDRYFHGRPSAAGSGYDAMASGGSNLGPTNPALLRRVETAVNGSRAIGEAGTDGRVPVDAVTASGSGLDPHITVGNALGQVARVAKARNMTEEAVRSIVSAHIEERDLGVLGEPRVNVLALNIALDDGETPPDSSAMNKDRLDPQTSGAIQLALIFAVLLPLSYALGLAMHRMLTGRPPAKEGTIFSRFEGRLYRVMRVDAKEDMGWKKYTACVLMFSFVSILFTYAVLRAQGALPLNPDGRAGVESDVALNTAVSFGTNTNWQVYSGEQTMSYLSQMLALTFQNFASAAAGLAVALALMRGVTARSKGRGLGNFWVDITRIILYILIPISLVAALFFVSQGVPQTFGGPIHAVTLEGANQTIPLGPVASQEAIKELGTNGGGFFNANSAHPFENPNPLTNFVQIILLLIVPFATLVMFGKMARRMRQGLVLMAVAVAFLIIAMVLSGTQEQAGNIALDRLGADQSPGILQCGGNMEGKEVRFGIYGSTTFAVATASTSCGAVNSMHDSYTPLGGMVPMFMILLGEVVPGGVGAGFFSLFMYVMLTIFIAGLMVGRLPSFLGKKIGAFEMKMTVLILILIESTILVFAALSLLTPEGLAGITNPGPHGLSQVLYAFGSGVGNNGSAFGGLGATSPWYITTMTIAMFIGRFFIMIPMLAIAGSFADKHIYPTGAGTLPTDNATFAVFLSGVIIIIAGLSFLPVLVLGPVLERLL